MKTVKARKLDMGQIFTAEGKAVAVTQISFAEMPADLAAGSSVKVVGTSKGKGFAGVMKRHGFGGLPMSHGASTKTRSPGSIGGRTTPGRVYKGKRMSGRMGGEKVTLRGLEVLEMNEEQKTAKLSGPVPGPRGSYFTLSYEPVEKVVEENPQPQVEGAEIKEEVQAEQIVEKKEEKQNEG